MCAALLSSYRNAKDDQEGFLLYFISAPCNVILAIMQRRHKDLTAMKVPTVSIIVAMTNKRVIGDKHGLPWHLPEDLQLFKRKTLGSAVIMGRKTYQSIGHPLSDRLNIVLSRTHERFSGVKVCQSIMEGLTEAAHHGLPVFVIGGAELYRKALPLATDLHISWVEENVAGDILFPAFNLDDWRVCEVTEYSGFKHIHYQRREDRS